MKQIRWLIILVSLAIAALILLRVSATWTAQPETPGSLLALAVAFLLPLGLTLVAWSTWPAEQADQVAILAPLGLALGLLGYLTLGFGFHFGGAAFISDNQELQGLSRFFSLVRGPHSPHWGLIGLEGFFLSGDASTPTATRLLLSQLPLISALTLIVMLALPRRVSPLTRLLAGFVASGITYPLAGHWVSGGGWLARLGQTLNLGHGLVDFGGTSTLFIVAGSTALATVLLFGHRRGLANANPNPKDDDLKGNDGPEEAVPMPPTRSALVAALGALLTVVGWIAMGLANPLYEQSGAILNWPLILLNGLAGLSGGALLAQLYSWFSTRRFNPLMGPRGALVGLIAVSAGAPFMPTWAALITGAVAGLLLPLAVYVVDHLWGLDDVTAALTTYGLSGLWGLLAVAFFASGRWGQGWNSNASLPGQGVSGLLVASGMQADGGQLGAQAWGAVALFAVGFLVPWGIIKLLIGLCRSRSRLGQWLPHRSSAPSLTSSREHQGASSSRDWVVDAEEGH